MLVFCKELFLDMKSISLKDLHADRDDLRFRIIIINL